MAVQIIACDELLRSGVSFNETGARGGTRTRTSFFSL